MTRRLSLVGVGAVPLALLLISLQPASAETGFESRACDAAGSCEAYSAESSRAEKRAESARTQSSGPRARVVPGKRSLSGPSTAQAATIRAAEVERKFKQTVAEYAAALARQRMCLETNVPITQVGNSSAFCPAPARPNTGLDTVSATLTPQRGQPVKTGPPRVTVTPREVAYLAVARLQLPRVVPGIGPSPKLNEWDMGVVGYPLWLWADGPTHVGPVSQAVANLSVSLDARIARMVFRMGDGATVRCRGTGMKWSWRVGPAKKSPSCGHTYTKPSLPKGDYTVTAIVYWAVRWSINGSSGVITMPMSSSTQLPVGELQVLVTR
jgi:hypothetical protein